MSHLRDMTSKCRRQYRELNLRVLGPGICTLEPGFDPGELQG